MTDADWPFTHFTPQEFDDPTTPGTGDLVSQKLVSTLEKIRERCGFPLQVTSGVRTFTHNAQVGGVGEASMSLGTLRTSPPLRLHEVCDSESSIP